MLLHDDLNYSVQLSGFEGPLDLLLRLIEREELDITNVALSQVADQYLAHVRAMNNPDPAAMSSFLVLAARLLLIKSRALLPRPRLAQEQQPEDDAEELVQQLRAYQRFKQAAELLRSWQDQGRRTFTRQAMPVLPPPTPAKLDASIGDMLAAVQRRLHVLLPLEKEAVPLPTPKIITVPHMAARIRQRLLGQAWFDFEDVLSVATDRVEVVVAFWAVLELWKREVILVEQRELFGPIQIGRGPLLHEFDTAHIRNDTGS